MRVVATAGHVDHGKSTLVRALTGTDPDRLAAEKARGLTIELGHAWTTLADGTDLALVDVPGHERFLGTMLAGLGPAPGVVFVVAADEGWRAQSTEHLAAINALDLTHGLLVITRADLADPAPALAEATPRLASSSLRTAPAVTVSAITGHGMDDLRASLITLCASLPDPVTTGRARLWTDRAFTLTGTGTVVTGTLERGTLRSGERVLMGGREAVVRSVQALGQPRDDVSAVARVAVALRGVEVADLSRTGVLTTGDWHRTTTVDVRLTSADDLPIELMAHVGTVAMPVRVRPLGPRLARLTWHRPLPLQAGDRFVLRDSGRHEIPAGAIVLDVDPPALTRRGDARRRASALAAAPLVPDPAAEVRRRGIVPLDHLRRLTGQLPQTWPTGIRVAAGWVITDERWRAWVATLTTVAAHHAAQDPLHPGLGFAAAAQALGLPDAALVPLLAADTGLTIANGHLTATVPDLGPAEQAIRTLEARWAQDPFAAPDRDELTALGLAPRHLAAAAKLGRVLDLGSSVVLPPDATERAVGLLAALPPPFTTSQARQALGTSRRVALLLLDLLDRRGLTIRHPDDTRSVRR